MLSHFHSSAIYTLSDPSPSVTHKRHRQFDLPTICSSWTIYTRSGMPTHRKVNKRLWCVGCGKGICVPNWPFRLAFRPKQWSTIRCIRASTCQSRIKGTHRPLLSLSTQINHIREWDEMHIYIWEPRIPCKRAINALWSTISDPHHIRHKSPIYLYPSTGTVACLLRDCFNNEREREREIMSYGHRKCT